MMGMFCSIKKVTLVTWAAQWRGGRSNTNQDMSISILDAWAKVEDINYESLSM